MRGAHAARYLFAACLCASTVDLIVVDGVVGPMALRGEPSSPTESAASVAAGSAATAPAQRLAMNGTAGASATSGTEAASSPATATATATARPPLAPRVVARFESDQPVATWEDLRPLAAEMKADPQARIVLEGHADPYGDPAHNRTLSLDRAKWAQARLVELGVSAARLEVIAHGAERPLDEGGDDAAVASNRRVEFRWLPSSPSREDRGR
jgi:peptidoglycan-associated lipoprotein